MKIAIISPFYKPSIGGVEYIVYHTARELAKRGYEVHVITTTCDNRWRKIAEPGTTIEEGVVVHRLEPSFIRIGYTTIMKGLKETLKKIKPDIVHCHNLHPHLFQAMKWKDELKYKLVAQLHFPVATGIDHLSAKLLYRLVMRRLMKNQYKVDVFIAHTNMEERWLINEGIEACKIRVIRYPCIPDELFEYKPKSDIHYKLSTDIVVTYISRIHPRKGQQLLLQAAKHLSEELRGFKVYIAGPISDHKYLQKLKKLIEELDLKRHVVLDPRMVPEQEKLDIIATSDIFSCTPILDIHPTIVLEALALGTPVVATSVGAIPELLSPDIVVEELSRDAQGRVKALLEETLWDKLQSLKNDAIALVEPKPVEIAKAIQRILQNRDSVNLETLTKMAYIHKTSSIVDRLVKLYESLKT